MDSGAGRRYLTQQLNQAYALLLPSPFQGFCHDLHEESIRHLVAAVGLPVLQATYRNNLMLGRKLDVGNPNPGNLGADFNRDEDAAIEVARVLAAAVTVMVPPEAV